MERDRSRIYKPGDAAREQAFGSGATAGATAPSGSAGGEELPAGGTTLKPDPNVNAPGTDGDHASSPVGKPGSRGVDKRNQGHLPGHAEEDVPNDAWPFTQEIKKP